MSNEVDHIRVWNWFNAHRPAAEPSEPYHTTGGRQLLVLLGSFLLIPFPIIGGSVSFLENRSLSADLCQRILWVINLNRLFQHCPDLKDISENFNWTWTINYTGSVVLKSINSKPIVAVQSSSTTGLGVLRRSKSAAINHHRIEIVGKSVHVTRRLVLLLLLHLIQLGPWSDFHQSVCQISLLLTSWRGHGISRSPAGGIVVHSSKSSRRIC